VQRFVEEVVGLALFDNVSQVHHGHPVADVVDDAQVVGDEEVGQVELLLQLFHQVNDLGLNGVDPPCG
jgi:hypothetical protein